MTDTWTQTIDRLKAAAHAEEEAGTDPTDAIPAPSAPVWPLAATPAEPASALGETADPLILELVHGPGPTSAPIDPLPSAPLAVVPPAIAHAPATTESVGLAAHAEPAGAEAPLSVYGRLPDEALAPAPPVHALLADAPVAAASAAPPLAPDSPQAAEVHAPAAEVTAPAPSSVAPMEKAVEPATEPAERAAVVASTPAPALVVAAGPPPTARPGLTDSHSPQVNDPQHGIDPVLAGFDHVVALAGYVLLFISVFMFGVPALATMALAYAHKNDSHLLVRSHYRFQLRIFWTAILFAVLAIASAVTAGGVAVTKLIDFAREHLPGVSAAMDHANVGAWSGQFAGVLLVAAVTLGVLAVIWTLVASLFGFLRLVANRPIGHQFAAK